MEELVVGVSCEWSDHMGPTTTQPTQNTKLELPGGYQLFAGLVAGALGLQSSQELITGTPTVVHGYTVPAGLVEGLRGQGQMVGEILQQARNDMSSLGYSHEPASLVGATSPRMDEWRLKPLK